MSRGRADYVILDNEICRMVGRKVFSCGVAGRFACGIVRECVTGI